MSGKFDKRKKKKNELKKRERAQKALDRKERLATERGVIARPKSWPLHDAFISQDPTSRGQAWVIASRRHTDGRMCGFASLIDLHGDGLVELELFDGSSPAALGNRLTEISSNHALLVREAADAMASLEDAIRMRRDAGHAAHPLVSKARQLFDDVDSSDAENPVFFEDTGDEPTEAPRTGGLLNWMLGRMGVE